MRRVFLVGILLGGLSVSGTGCSLAPKSFRDMIHPAPIVRARAVGLDDQQPESVAVPALIARLSDPDRVVRMTANDGLKERTKRDFGFVPWSSAEDRTLAVSRWNAWWEERKVQAGYPKDDALLKVSTRSSRRRRNGVKADQGGTQSSWPATPVPAPSTSPPEPPPRPSSLADTPPAPLPIPLR